MKTYHCLDCSYEGRRFRQGRCPACGSANIRGEGGDTDEDTPRKPYGLILCLGLWTYLGWEIIRRYIS